MSDQSVFVIIPAYEPDVKLLELLIKIKKETDYKAIVVNDGSGASSDRIFRLAENDAIVICHQRNRGKGAAIKTAMSYMLDSGMPMKCIVTADADGQHTISDIKKVSLAYLSDKNGMVVGARRFLGAVPIRSRFGNYLTRAIFQLVTRTKLYDTQTGLRAFGEELVPIFLAVKGERYEYEMNVLMECVKRKISIHEEEIETIYINENSSSHFHIIRDSIRIYKEIFRFSASSLFSFMIDYVLFIIMTYVTRNLILSNIVARVISAGMNFTLNKTLVFQSKGSVTRETRRYVILAGVILAINSMVLFLINQLGINRYLSKIMVEVMLFAFSYRMQRLYIFSNQKQ